MSVYGAKGNRNILFAHTQKSADANDQGDDITVFVDKNVIMSPILLSDGLNTQLEKLVTVVPAGNAVKIWASPEVIGAGCCAKAATLIPIANTVAAVAEMIFLVFVLSHVRSLLRGWACGATL
jgi:hypothetical protein